MQGGCARLRAYRGLRLHVPRGSARPHGHTAIGMRRSSDSARLVIGRVRLHRRSVVDSIYLGLPLCRHAALCTSICSHISGPSAGSAAAHPPSRSFPSVAQNVPRQSAPGGRRRGPLPRPPASHSSPPTVGSSCLAHRVCARVQAALVDICRPGTEACPAADSSAAAGPHLRPLGAVSVSASAVIAPPPAPAPLRPSQSAQQRHQPRPRRRAQRIQSP